LKIGLSIWKFAIGLGKLALSSILFAGWDVILAAVREGLAAFHEIKVELVGIMDAATLLKKSSCAI
jgi:hypothetical protein